MVPKDALGKIQVAVMGFRVWCLRMGMTVRQVSVSMHMSRRVPMGRGRCQREQGRC